MTDAAEVETRADPRDGVALADLRADARHNRQRIIDVARRLFAERGLDVPMAAIARNAGVGMATLYRRFPTRQDLLAEVFAEQFAQCEAIIEAALADPDPWNGLRSAVEGLAAMQAADHGFSAAFIGELPDAAIVGRKMAEGMQGFRQLVHRAQAAGKLRPDFAFADLALILMANGGVVGAAGRSSDAAAASRRLVGYLLDAFRTPGAPVRPLPPPVPLSFARAAFPPDRL